MMKQFNCPLLTTSPPTHGVSILGYKICSEDEPTKRAHSKYHLNKELGIRDIFWLTEFEGGFII